jgi:hypothetical protein
MTRRKTLLLAYALVGVGVAAIGTLAFAMIASPDDPRDSRHCFIDRPPARTLVVSLDVSDPLTSVHPREVAFDVDRSLAGLRSGERVVVIDAAGKPPTEIATVVDQCHPGDDDNTARNAFRDEILRPIARHVNDVRSKPASNESPLAETITGVAADPSLHAAGSKLDILFITDGLQNSALESAYRSGSEFPTPAPGLLSGVKVELDLVKNERDFALQPRAVARLLAWLTAAGARVVYAAPAWLSLADPPRHRRHARWK